jgi:hypothetical protein
VQGAYGRSLLFFLGHAVVMVFVGNKRHRELHFFCVFVLLTVFKGIKNFFGSKERASHQFFEKLIYAGSFLGIEFLVNFLLSHIFILAYIDKLFKLVEILKVYSWT